jgi:glyoxylase-like metal-dependent hydrolase (beta-lactamase superfamily II)
MINRALQDTPRHSKGNHIGHLSKVARDVAGVQLSMVNVYFIGPPKAGDRGWVLVDAGMPTSEHAIVREAERRFGSSRPAAIILTHGHFDHVGSAQALSDLWDAPIYAHRLEMPYITGRSPYPPQDPTVDGGAVAKLLSRLFPKGPFDLGSRVQILPQDGSVPGLSGWRWIHTPGHAPGHVSLFREEGRVLIVGDAFVTMRQESLTSVITRKPEVWRPPAYFTPDWEAARTSVEALAQLDPEVAATGHGIPMSGARLRRGLNDLVEHFDEVMPDHGRYVDHPAVTDEEGVVALPPRVFDPVPAALVSLGVVALLGGKLLRGRSAERRELSGRRADFRRGLSSIPVPAPASRYQSARPATEGGRGLPAH